MKRPIEILAAVRVDRAAVLATLAAAGLVPTERRAWLSRTVSGTVHVLADVPGAEFDLLICDDPPVARRWTWALEACHKAGRFDGKQRPHLCLRPMEPAVAPEEIGTLQILAEGESAWPICVGSDLGGWVCWVLPRLRATLHPEGLGRIVGWHAGRFFRHLRPDDVAEVDGLFAAEVAALMRVAPVGLAEANRLAERLLYRASVEAGWRKLTARERSTLGLADSGHWHRADDVAVRRAARRGYPADGVGDWTHEVAAGGVPVAEVEEIVRRPTRR